jgi:uncharacterized protein YjbJ (UPF0337 family)
MEFLIMTDSKGKVDKAKEKVIGEVEQAVGKITGNETLELKGIIRTLKPDLQEKKNISEMVDELKEGVAEY